MTMLPSPLGPLLSRNCMAAAEAEAEAVPIPVSAVALGHEAKSHGTQGRWWQSRHHRLLWTLIFLQDVDTWHWQCWKRSTQQHRLVCQCSGSWSRCVQTIGVHFSRQLRGLCLPCKPVFVGTYCMIRLLTCTCEENNYYCTAMQLQLRLQLALHLYGMVLMRIPLSASHFGTGFLVVRAGFERGGAWRKWSPWRSTSSRCFDAILFGSAPVQKLVPPDCSGLFGFVPTLLLPVSL